MNKGHPRSSRQPDERRETRIASVAPRQLETVASSNTRYPPGTMKSFTPSYEDFTAEAMSQSM